MTRVATIPSRDLIGPDTPLRLDVAAAIAYPDGSMSSSGLRAESRRGRLVIERTAGKDYTTLANIDRMRELCRREAKAQDCGSGQRDVTMMVTSPTLQPGSSEMTAADKSAQDALETTVRALKQGLQNTSPPSTTKKRRPNNVVPLRSR